MLCYKQCSGNYSNEASWAGRWLVISKPAWNFKKSQAIKVFNFKSWITFLTSWHQSLQGSEIFQNYAKTYTSLPWNSLCMSVHTHKKTVLDQQLHEHSVFPGFWTSPSRISAGQGKNSEHRAKWCSWVSSDSWHSTLWLKLILPKGTTCASKQMENKRSFRKPHTSDPSTTTCLQSYGA